MALYQTGEAPIVLPEMWGQTVRLDDDADAVVNASGNVTLFAFNSTPDGRPDAPTFHPPQSGSVRLQFKLNGSAGHAIRVLICAELENVMQIDNDNSVLYNDDSSRMELIAMSDQQLRHLGYHNPDLALYFAWLFPSDRLPTRPVDDRPRGYIVNIDTHN